MRSSILLFVAASFFMKLNAQSPAGDNRSGRVSGKWGDTALLKEVTVIRQKNAVSLSLEKRVFTVSKNITSTGGTAENILQNVPSITIDADGSARLRSMTTTIYVDGKPTLLTLAQIPASQIEFVEVISNPSAKYDAATAGGIVNLVLKKDRRPGTNGMISGGVGNNSRIDGNLSLDLNRGKWSVSALYGVNATRNPLTTYVHRITAATDTTPRTWYDQHSTIRLNNLFQSGRIAVSFNTNSKNELSLAATVVSGRYDNIASQEYSNRDVDNKALNYGQRSTRPGNAFTNEAMEFGWKRFFRRRGTSLSLTANFNQNRVTNTGDWYTTRFDGDGSMDVNYPEQDRISGRTAGNQFIAQVDYILPVNDSTKLEMGLRSYTYNRTQQYYFSTLDGPSQQYLLQDEYSQNAKINESVQAFYLLYSRRLNKGYSYQAGLRLEQSRLHGLDLLQGTTFGYNYPSSGIKGVWKMMFPSLAVARQFNKTTELGFSFTRKTSRPNWKHYFSGIQSNDPQNITIGNPNIQPEFVSTVEMNLNKRFGPVNWLSTIYYQAENNSIKPLIYPSITDPSVFITTYTNAKTDSRTGFDNTLTFAVGKRLQVMVNANAFNVLVESDTTRNCRWALNSKFSLTYSWPAGFSTQLSGGRESRFPLLQGYRAPVWGADLAIRKSFLNNKASLIFLINDICDSRKPVILFDQPVAYQESMTRREIRYYKLSLQLSFGGSKGASSVKKPVKIAKPDVDFSN